MTEPTGKDVKAIRERIGLSAEGFARALKLRGEHGGRTIRRWEAGENDIPGPVIAMWPILEMIAEFLEAGRRPS